MSERSGKVQTVRGLVDPGEFGHTQTHEHLLITLLPPEMREQLPPDEPLRLDNLWKVRFYKFDEEHPGLIGNVMKLDSEEDATDEMHLYKASGGTAIVEVTSIGIDRNPEALARISAATDVHVVMGAAYYEQAYHPAETADWEVEQFAEQILRDVVDGADGTGIRSGMIGEIGTGWPLQPQEAKVIAGSARAQRQSGAPVMIHPGRDTQAPIEAMRVLEKAGGNPERTIMAHIDRTLFDLAAMRELAATGCFLEFDLFGWESSYYPVADIDMPNDALRIDHLKRLFDAGYGDRLVIAQDICQKTRLKRYGGESYSHILNNVLPMMERKGLGQAEIQKLCVDNPRSILAFE